MTGARTKSQPHLSCPGTHCALSLPTAFRMSFSIRTFSPLHPWFSNLINPDFFFFFDSCDYSRVGVGVGVNQGLVSAVFLSHSSHYILKPISHLNPKFARLTI